MKGRKFCVEFCSTFAKNMNIYPHFLENFSKLESIQVFFNYRKNKNYFLSGLFDKKFDFRQKF